MILVNNPDLMDSPEYVQTSLAAALSLGLEKGRFKDRVKLTGLNLLLVYDKECAGRCAYCGISRNSKNTGGKKTFIRVKWPVYRLDEIIERTLTHPNFFQRICISMITNHSAVKDTVSIIKKIKEKLDLPISILISPTIITDKALLYSLKEAGGQMAGIAIDAATPEIFKRFRGKGVGGPHKWEKYWEVLGWALDVFGRNMAGIHLIAGLGETEKEMVGTIYRAFKMGSGTHLFSFYPEAGSLLENHNCPELLRYRKIQIAAYLINHAGCSPETISFDSKGNITGFNCDLEKIIHEGFAFMTSGCPGNDCRYAACNRPLANERPSEDFRNYPFIPDEEDKKTIKKQVESLLAVKI
ncbi:MAG: radical SAM protein [Actinobacteria bacterium]|nr:radical SAM protein [Actinomycetota bacterium]